MNAEGRTWIAGGALAGLLVCGGAAALAMVSDSSPDAGNPSITLDYVSSTGAICVVEIRPAVFPAYPSAWLIARSYLVNVATQSRDLAQLIDETGPTGQGADLEVEALVDALSVRAEQEIFRRNLSRVDVTLTSEHSCTILEYFSDYSAVVPAIVGDDFGREPTLNAGRAPDAVGFFRASTGQICEIQIKVDADWVNGASGIDATLAARAFLASVDFTAVDYSATLRDMADYWPDDHDEGEAEASALAQTLVRQAHQGFDTSYAESLPITTETWVQCDQP